MKTAKRKIAQNSNVPIQSSGWKDSLFIVAIPRIMLPVSKALDETEPCQPPTVSMPVRWLRNLEHERGAIIATLKRQYTGDDNWG